MDPQYEQRLRDEVIYLHSLWHQGPPRAAAAAASSPARHHLQPANATQFKKVKNRGARNKKNTANNPATAAPEPISSPGIEWKCPTPPPPASASGGWPNLAAKPDPNPLPFSPEDQLKSAARRAHHHAIRAVHEFFRSNSDGDSDAIDSSSDEDDDDDSMDEDCGRGEYSFFFNLFKEDAELRDYYAKNFAKGEFSCLVCGAVGGKKMGKKYTGCLPLVQHSISIGKTKKKKKAHKAFALAVCKVLSWDIDRLPAIVSSLSDKPREAEGNGKNNVDFVEGDTVEGKIDNADQESGLVVTGNLSNADDGHMNSLTCPSPEWKLPTPPLAEAASGWPSWKAKTDPKPIPISPEDQLISAARHAHQNAINVVRDFFRCNNNDDDSDAMDCSSDEEDDDSSNEDDDARDEYNFFFKVFKEDAELRECYEKNFAKGEFSCLVCGAIGGKKMGKKYTGCLALVQHSIAAGKTKKKRAHKAFALAVCKVLSWDIDQLQTVASLLSDKSGETEGNSDNKESSRTVDNLDSVEGKNDNAVQVSVPVDSEILSNDDDGNMNSSTCPATKNSEEISMVQPHKREEPAAEGLASNSSTCPDDNKVLENTDMVRPRKGEEPAAEGLASNSSACPHVDKNLENLGMVHPDNVKEPASEGLVVVPLHVNTSVVDEMPDLQTGNAILTELSKGDEI
ncbi:PREDICTED: uncharacterized protein LOC105968127 [Erythranthe guttata]|uniref:uncharacterized protein LOC105968127 n=1 Tax=Erythranthe guttata TaxID=4155 RepID=UPI00064D7CF3|nr:PREDICTED: uncharacterized protein LOC105968127 [Erythranthe guttata]|eukprot:XP_012848205.1 PREDICTED: uncharacterized protein LOC105968127 [Erythranthe guttata]